MLLRRGSWSRSTRIFYRPNPSCNIYLHAKFVARMISSKYSIIHNDGYMMNWPINLKSTLVETSNRTDKLNYEHVGTMRSEEKGTNFSLGRTTYSISSQRKKKKNGERTDFWQIKAAACKEETTIYYPSSSSFWRNIFVSQYKLYSASSRMFSIFLSNFLLDQFPLASVISYL